MIKAVRFFGDALEYVLNKYVGKQVSIKKNNFSSVVKSRRAWRNKRHLKTLYKVDGYMMYSGYRLNTYELILTLLNEDKYTPPPGGYAEWTPL